MAKPKSPSNTGISSSCLDGSVVVNEGCIATIDIETLSLNLDCVVYEIGLVITNLLPKPGVRWNAEHVTALEESKDDRLLFRQQRIKLSILEQQLLGRSATADTFAFHKNILKKQGIDAVEYFQDHQSLSCSTKNARDELKAIWSAYAPKEVWVNHTSFDMPRISGALYGGEANALPWNYRQEYDLFTAKQMWRRNRKDKTAPDPFKFPEDEKAYKHDSISDCLYNLSALSICLVAN